jgi:hypothetical protein
MPDFGGVFLLKTGLAGKILRNCILHKAKPIETLIEADET